MTETITNSEMSLTPAQETALRLPESTYSLEEAKKLVQQAIEQLNQTDPTGSYQIFNERQCCNDQDGVDTLVFQFSYTWAGERYLLPTEIVTCVQPATVEGKGGEKITRRKGMDLTSENIATVLSAAKIQLLAGIQENGRLIQRHLQNNHSNPPSFG